MHVVVDDSVDLRPKLGLFGGYGIELEYMIVDRASLYARPISDLLLKDRSGAIVNEMELEGTCWSNELVMHVFEIKSRGPTSSLVALKKLFERDIKSINEKLAKHHCMLLPTGMHPFFNPTRETKIWTHEQNEIYDTYNQIFNCQGHGWSNLQSMHINLPFADNDEFGKLHAAIRLVLPILPALAASSPLCETKHSGFLDQRLEFYRQNQKAIPAIAGSVIPEPVFTIQDYHDKILQPMFHAVKPYDTKNILQEEWLNSRGAIARFERNAIEIRLLDTQECPRMDLAIAATVISLIKSLVDGRWIAYPQQKLWSEAPLFEIFKKSLKEGDQAVIDHFGFLQIFDKDARSPVKANQLWRHIVHSLLQWGGYPIDDFSHEINFLLSHGTLSRRILKALDLVTLQSKNPTSIPNQKESIHHKQTYKISDIQKVYLALAQCLAKGESFDPREFS